MPSFFESMKRLIQGKPVFDANDLNQNSHPPQTLPAPPPPSAQPNAPQSTIRKGDDRTFPVVYVKRTKANLNGPNMEVYSWIHNKSSVQIELDKIRVLNTTRELDTQLRPNEEKEFLIYKGPRLDRERDREAQLDYKTVQEGDYFRALHDIEFQIHPDKTYSIEDLHLHMPIRDIYG